jgi:hypothetical protein
MLLGFAKGVIMVIKKIGYMNERYERVQTVERYSHILICLLEYVIMLCERYH